LTLVAPYQKGDVRVSHEAEEHAKCKGNLDYFCSNYVITNDTQRGLGPMPFPDYPYLHRVANELQVNRLNLIFKPRHMLITWLLAAKRIWKANFNPYIEPLVLSQGQLYADAFAERCWFIWEHLPEFLKADAIQHPSEIEWPKLHSKIISLPCTKNAGRSLSSSDVTMDEAAFFEYGSETYAAIVPTIDTFGTLDICSTPNGKDPLFYELCTDENYAKKFHKIDLDWRDHPGRDEQWKADIIATIGLRRWLREYEKFWFAPLGKPVFAENWIDQMEQACFEQWKHANMILCGIDRGYHHPAALWEFVNTRDQLCKVREFMPSNMTRDSFIKSVDEQSKAMFPGKSIQYFVPYDCTMDESDGMQWIKIMQDSPFNWSIRVGKGGADEKVRRTDAQRKQMKIRADQEFAMLVDPACQILLEGYKGGYCYPKAINKPEKEKPEKDGWYDHIQDTDAVICDTYFAEPQSRGRLVSPTQDSRFDKVTGRRVA